MKYLQSKKENWNTDDEKEEPCILHSSLIIGLLVFGHWILDFMGWPLSVWLSDAKGIPFLFANTPNYGLGLYTNWTGALIMEVGVLLVGILIYVKYRKNRRTKLVP